MLLVNRAREEPRDWFRRAAHSPRRRALIPLPSSKRLLYCFHLLNHRIGSDSRIAGWQKGMSEGRTQQAQDVSEKLRQLQLERERLANENARLLAELAAVRERLDEAERLNAEMIAEISTPVIPIWDRVLLAPIVGTLTAERAEALTDTLLQKTASGAEVVILDITGVPTVDTDAAQHLRNTVSAVRVLGAQCILTGIRASVAQTLVHLGIRLEEIITRRKLSDALHLALDTINKR